MRITAIQIVMKGKRRFSQPWNERCTSSKQGNKMDVGRSGGGGAVGQGIN